MVHYTRKDIDGLKHIQRINLINSCSGYKSANLLATISQDGITNVAVFSSVTHLGSNPPVLGFILRPTSIPRNTYKNIKETGVFTINHIYNEIIEDAHHTSAKYPEHISEFDMTSLEVEYKKNCCAPFVKRSPVQLKMKYLEEYFIKTNEVLHIIAEIQDIYVNDDLLEEDGFINLAKGKIAAINGLDAYAIAKENTRFEYQRPKVLDEKAKAT
ncbi:flavin reductase family protein [Pseudotenacibaculum haliotis]|uniref:Flavin reductase family protein n=1 Tax=Pseudotenacibaculum haliotis TaxID=1862138 RepID=A0ABW5LTI8_9FLAO